MIGNGLLRRAGALALVVMVMMSVAVCTATPAAHALHGGGSAFTADPLPCEPACTFTADNSADALDVVSVDGVDFPHATWWTFQATGTTSLTVRAAADGAWDPVLVLADADATVLAAATDSFGRPPALTATVQAGAVYLLAMAGYGGADQGTAAMTLTTGTPDAPGDVGAAAFDASAGVTWSAPDDHGDPVTEYRVYVNGSSTYTAVPAPATSTTLTDLTVGASYVFEVSAVNAAGESARSAPTAEVLVFGSTTTTLVVTPSAPSWPNSFTLQAQVTSSIEVDAGSVNFFRNGTPAGAIAVTDGVANLGPLTLAPGNHTFVANYAGATQFSASGASRSITVSKGAQVITFQGIASTGYSTGTVSISPTSSSGLAVGVASTTPSVCTVRTGVVTLVAGGTCSLTATQTGNAYWSAAPAVVRSFAVVEQPQYLTFEAPGDRSWSADPLPVSASSTSGLTVSFASLTTDVCTIANEEVTLRRTGTCTVRAVQDGDARWAAAQVQRSFTVWPATPATLTAHVSALELQVGDQAVVSATGGSGDGAVSFAVVDGDLVCAVDGTTLTALADGVCIVRAAQAGDDRFASNESTGVTVTVLAPPPTTTTTTTTTSTTTTTVPATSTTTSTTSTTTTTAPPRPAMLTTFVAVHAADTHPSVAHELPTPERRLRAGEVLSLQMTGLAGRVPSQGVGAVAMTVTIDGATAAGHLTAYPCGVRPTASMANFGAGRTVTGAALVPVDAVTGRVCVTSTTAAHVAIDVTGWTAAEGGHHAVGPARVIDTRPGMRAARDVPRRQLQPGVTLRVALTDLRGLTPRDGVAAVVLHVTTVNAAGPGHLTVWPCDAVPRTSTANFSGPNPVANFAVVGVSPAGEVCFAASRATHLVVDVTGWIEAGRGFTAVSSRRVVDTRPGSTAPAPARGRIEPGTVVPVRLTDLGGAVPDHSVGALTVNVTVVPGRAPGVVRLGACDGSAPTASVSFAAGQTVAGGAVLRVPLGDPRWCITSSAGAHVVVDVSGWFAAGTPG